MKKIIRLSLIAALCSVSLTALAAGDSNCHFHGYKPATETVVANCANQQKNEFIKNGKIDANWQSVGVDKIGITEGKKGKEWRVVFSNPNATDKAKKSLFMFFTLPGNFIAANFTGE